MASETVTLEIPAQVYADLQALASEEQADPAEIIARPVATAQRRRAWVKALLVTGRCFNISHSVQYNLMYYSPSR